MRNYDKPTIREAIAAMATTHASFVVRMEQLIDMLHEALESENSANSSRSILRANQIPIGPIVNHQTYSIDWRGKSCPLKNTLLFWFFERLSRSPNRYVSHLDLLDDVWRAERTSATIRGVAKRLRDRLTAAGMEELASAINGEVAGYYCLKRV